MVNLTIPLLVPRDLIKRLPSPEKEWQPRDSVDALSAFIQRLICHLQLHRNGARRIGFME